MADLQPAFSPPTPIRGHDALRSRNLTAQPTMEAVRHTAPRLPRRRAILASALSAAAICLLGPTTAHTAEPKKVIKSAEEWREQLTPAQYYVLRESGTERPFSSPLNAEKRRGRFVCAGCAQPLFASDAKYESGTGWPSFFRSLPDSVSLIETPFDRLMLQKEVRCAKCDGHLGHVFPDGPRPTGKRYCMNGVALAFEPLQT